MSVVCLIVVVLHLNLSYILETQLRPGVFSNMQTFMPCCGICCLPLNKLLVVEFHRIVIFPRFFVQCFLIYNFMCCILHAAEKVPQSLS